MKKFWFMVLLGCLFVGRNSYAKIIDYESFKLDNGLEVVVLTNHRVPLGYSKLYYKAGAFNDPYSKGGIAHLLEHLMFRGTKRVKDKEFNRITEEVGASDNAYTTYGHTAYYEFSDISKLELMLALEADRMANLMISDEVFYKERDVVLEERLQRFETDKATEFYEKLRKLFWDKHLYARPVSGEVEEIKNLKKEDAVEFYKKYYKPANAMLVLAGDISLDEAKEVVNKYFGKIENKNDEEIKIDVIEPKSDEIMISLTGEGIEHKRFVAYWYLEKENLSRKEKYALDFLNEYLSGDDSSFLYKKLVYQDKKFLSIGVDADYDKKIGGNLMFYGVPVDEKMGNEEFRKIIDENIKQGVDSLDKERLEKIKNEMLSNAVYLISNVNGLADFVGKLKIKGVSDDDIMRVDEMIKSIEIEDVKNVYEKVFLKKRRKVYAEIDKLKD